MEFTNPGFRFVCKFSDWVEVGISVWNVQGGLSNLIVLGHKSDKFFNFIRYNTRDQDSDIMRQSVQHARHVTGYIQVVHGGMACAMLDDFKCVIEHIANH